MAGSPLMFRDVISENIHRNHRASLSISQSMMVLRQVVSEILGQGLQLVVLYLGQQGLRAAMRAIESEVRVSEVIGYVRRPFGIGPVTLYFFQTFIIVPKHQGKGLADLLWHFN